MSGTNSTAQNQFKDVQISLAAITARWFKEMKSKIANAIWAHAEASKAMDTRPFDGLL